METKQSLSRDNARRRITAPSRLHEDAPRIGPSVVDSAHGNRPTAQTKCSCSSRLEETTSLRAAKPSAGKLQTGGRGGRVTGAPAVPEEDNHVNLRDTPPASCLAWTAKSRAHRSPRYRLSPRMFRPSKARKHGRRSRDSF